MSDQLPRAPAVRNVRMDLHLAGVLLFALLLRLLYLGEQGATSVLFFQPLLDEQELTATAKNLIAQHSFGSEPLFKAPLYPLVLAATMLCTGKYWYWTIRVLQHLAGVLLVLMAWDTTRRLAPRGRMRLIAADVAGLCIASYGPLIRLENCINLDSLAVFFQSGLIYCVVRMLSSRGLGSDRYRWVMFAGIFAALSWLNRPTITPVLPLLAVWIYFCWKNWRPALLFLLLPVLGMGAMAVRNYMTSGETLVLPWQGGFNFFESNRRGVHGRYLQQSKFAFSATGNPTHALALDGFKEAVSAGQVVAPAHGKFYRSVDRYWFHKGLDEIAAEPGAWFRLMLSKWRDLLSAKEIYSYEEYDVQRELSVILGLLPLNFGCIWPFTLASAALIGLYGRRQRIAKLLWLYGVGLGMAISLYYTSGRLRMPLIFPAMVLGVAGIAQLLLTGRKSYGRVIGYVLLLAVGIIISWCDWAGVRSESRRGVEYARLSNAAYYDGRPELALQYLAKAEAAEPEYPTLHLLRGQALYASGRNKEARREFELSIQALPGDPVGPFNLGALLYYDSAETTAAMAALAEALRRQPNYSRAAALLTLIYLSKDQVNEARALLTPFLNECTVGASLQLLTSALALSCATNQPREVARLTDIIQRSYGSQGMDQVRRELGRTGMADCAAAEVHPKAE
ncbi:MAG: tetratricopeptide repeat protein [Candidatus Sumerlaeaceae bacterium]